MTKYRKESEVREMLERREDIRKAAEKVARVLVESQVTFSDVRRVFDAATDFMTVQMKDQKR